VSGRKFIASGFLFQTEMQYTLTLFVEMVDASEQKFNSTDSVQFTIQKECPKMLINHQVVFNQGKTLMLVDHLSMRKLEFIV